MLTTNQFEKYLAQAVTWIREHQERFWAIAGTVLLTVLLIGLLINRRQTQNTQAWFQLGNAQGQLMQGNLDNARKTLQDWETTFQGTEAATYAKFMKADLLYRTSDYVQAARIYHELAQAGRPEVIRPLALSAETAAEEMAGHIPQALALAKTFLETYPDHFMAGPMYLSQARLSELAGNPAAAAAIYERFVLLFPQSPWTDLARGRSQTLPRNK